MESVIDQLELPKSVNGYIYPLAGISRSTLSKLWYIWDFEDDRDINLMLFNIDDTIIMAQGKEIADKLSRFHSGKNTISRMRDQAIWDIGFTQRRRRF